MQLTQQEIEHIAHLARLRLSPEELEHVREQVSSILNYMQLLQEADVDGVEPTAQVTELASVLRTDTVQQMLSHEAVLANAPDQADGMFRVKAVFDEA